MAIIIGRGVKFQISNDDGTWQTIDMQDVLFDRTAAELHPIGELMPLEAEFKKDAPAPRPTPTNRKARRAEAARMRRSK